MANNADYSEMISGIMSDPEAMNNVLKIARNLMGNGGITETGSSAQQNPDDTQEKVSKIFENVISHNDGNENKTEAASAFPAASLFADKEAAANREKLLIALKPYLNSERSNMVDTILKLLQLAKIADIGKLLGYL